MHDLQGRRHEAGQLHCQCSGNPDLAPIEQIYEECECDVNINFPHDKWESIREQHWQANI